MWRCCSAIRQQNQAGLAFGRSEHSSTGIHCTTRSVTLSVAHQILDHSSVTSAFLVSLVFQSVCSPMSLPSGVNLSIQLAGNQGLESYWETCSSLQACVGGQQHIIKCQHVRRIQVQTASTNWWTIMWMRWCPFGRARCVRVATFVLV
jgi:hypothetical protein